MAFAPKVRKARFNYSGLTSQQMLTLAEFAAVDIRGRIQQGLTVDDQAAPPLKESYARAKMRRGRSGIRDLTWTGFTLRSLRPLRVNDNRATIGFLNLTHPVPRKRGSVTTNQILAINQRRSRQFGWSPRNKAFIAAQVRKVRIVKVSRVA